MGGANPYPILLTKRGDFGLFAYALARPSKRGHGEIDMKLRNILAGAGVVAALAFASAASADTYNLGNLSITKPLSVSVSDTGTSVDDTFNFSIVPPPLTTYGQLVNYFVSNPTNGATISDVFSSGTISLYDATNTLLDQVSIFGNAGIGATTVTDATILPVGDYHFVVDGTVYNNGPVNYT